MRYFPTHSARIISAIGIALMLVVTASAVHAQSTTQDNSTSKSNSNSQSNSNSDVLKAIVNTTTLDPIAGIEFAPRSGEASQG